MCRVVVVAAWWGVQEKYGVYVKLLFLREEGGDTNFSVGRNPCLRRGLKGDKGHYRGKQSCQTSSPWL